MYDQGVRTPIMNTYVPIDFRNLYLIGAHQQKVVEDAANKLNTALQKFGEFTSISDIDEQKYYDASLGKMRDLVDQFAKNPDVIKDAAYRSAFQSRLNSIDYNFLARLKKNAANFDTRSKAVSELIAQGKYVDWFDDQRYTDLRNWDTESQGMMTNLSPAPYVDLEELGRDYVKDLKPSFYKGVSPNTGQRIPFYNWMAISKDNIKQPLVQHYTDIINSPGGKKHFDRYSQMYLAQNPEATQDEIVNSFVDRLVEAQSDKLIETPIIDQAALTMAKIAADERLARTRFYGRSSGTGNQPQRPFNYVGSMLNNQAQAQSNQYEKLRGAKGYEWLKNQSDANDKQLNSDVRDFFTNGITSDSSFGEMLRKASSYMMANGEAPRDASEWTSKDMNTALQYAVGSMPNDPISMQYLQMTKNHADTIAKQNNDEQTALVFDTLDAFLGTDPKKYQDYNNSKNGGTPWDNKVNIMENLFKDVTSNVFNAIDESVRNVMGSAATLNETESDNLINLLYGSKDHELSGVDFQNFKSPYQFLSSSYEDFAAAAEEAKKKVNYSRDSLIGTTDAGPLSWESDKWSSRDMVADGYFANKGAKLGRIYNFTKVNSDTPNEYAFYGTVKVPIDQFDNVYSKKTDTWKWSGVYHNDVDTEGLHTVTEVEKDVKDGKTVTEEKEYVVVPTVFYNTLDKKDLVKLQRMFDDGGKGVASTSQRTASDASAAVTYPTEWPAVE